nr:HNH endonuclease [uncultured Ruminococcus sp.]
MEFNLNDYHRNITDEELLDDIRRVAEQLNKASLTRDEYLSNGKYHWSTIANRFGGWNASLTKAGLEIKKPQNRNKNNINVSDEELIADIVRVCNNLNQETITSSVYDNCGKHGCSMIILRFGSWEKALKKAGLEGTGFHHYITDEELLKEIERVWIILGRQPTTTDIKNGISNYSLNSYSRRFGSWRKALEAFVEYINNESDEDISETVEFETELETDTIKQKSIEQRNDGQEQTFARKTTRDVNLRLRFRVMQRDNFKCCICGASPAKDPSVELHIDHIIPWSKGGETVMDNLQTLCSKCNLGKSDLM